MTCTRRANGLERRGRVAPFAPTLRACRAVIRRSDDRLTLLMVGRGEPMEAALRVALDRHGMSVEVTPSMQAVEAVMVRAPDLVLLIGDAASEGGVALLRHLAENPVTSVIPV